VIKIKIRKIRLWFNCQRKWESWQYVNEGTNPDQTFYFRDVGCKCKRFFR